MFAAGLHSRLLLAASLVFHETVKHVQASQHVWSYQDTNWKGVCASGIRQSPIDIKDYESVSGEEIIFSGYGDVPSSIELRNNGHSAKVSITAPNMPYITKGGLPGTFKFAQLHFHWGNSSSSGSEHLVDGVAYPLEVHWVHYNTKYNDITEAVNMVDGLAALSVLYEISSKPNDNLSPIIDILYKVKKATNDKKAVTPFRLDRLLPKDRSRFYRYDGSLTTPTCNEVVTWTVFQEKQHISESQIERFRELQLEEMEESDLSFNYRPVQPLFGRKIQLIGDRSSLIFNILHGNLHCSNGRLQCSIGSLNCSIGKLHYCIGRLHCPKGKLHCAIGMLHCSSEKRHCANGKLHYATGFHHSSTGWRPCSSGRLQCSSGKLHCSNGRRHCSFLLRFPS